MDEYDGDHQEDSLEDLDELLADWQDTVEIPLLGSAEDATLAFEPVGRPEPLPATLALVPFPPPPPDVPAGRAAPNAWTSPVPALWAPQPTTVVLSDRQDPPAAVLVAAWTLALVTFGYLLPWAVAATRGRSNHGGIAVVNLLLGWTGVGWAVALVMACSAHRPVLVQVFPSPLAPRTAGAGWSAGW